LRMNLSGSEVYIFHKLENPVSQYAHKDGA
jgi:hypothetical protein